MHPLKRKSNCSSVWKNWQINTKSPLVREESLKVKQQVRRQPQWNERLQRSQGVLSQFVVLQVSPEAEIACISNHRLQSHVFLFFLSGWESSEGNSDGGPAGGPQRVQQEAPQQHPQPDPVKLVGGQRKGDLTSHPLVCDNSVCRAAGERPFSGLSGSHKGN